MSGSGAALTIGEAARLSGISAKMIRYYESVGLLRPARRSAGNYRTYAEADVHRLRFVSRARRLGFSPAAVRRLLGLWDDRTRPSAAVKRLALDTVAELRGRAAELDGMARALEHLAAHCRGDARPECPILDDLAGV